MNTDHPLIAKIVRAERALRSNPRSAVEQYDAIIADARFGELDAPLRSACHLNRGFQQRALGRSRVALADYERAAKLAPGSFKPHLNAGLVLAQDLHEFAAAMAAFDRGISLNPGCVEALYSRALVKMAIHDYDGAEADLISALALAPEDPNALSNLGTLQMKRGRIEQAADSFQKALGFAPLDTEIRFNAALALDRLGMQDAAQDVLRRDRRAVRMWAEKGGRRVARVPKFALIKFAVLFLFGLGSTLLIGLVYPAFLLTSLALGVVGFTMGKSTRVPLNPRDVPFSPMITLSYRDFDRWARQNALRRIDPSFFSRTDVHCTEKLSVLFSSSDASGHCFEPGRSTTKMLFVDLALGAFIFIPAIRGSFHSLDSRGALFFQIMCGLALGQVAGWATGRFFRWIRGQM